MQRMHRGRFGDDEVMVVGEFCAGLAAGAQVCGVNHTKRRSQTMSLNRVLAKLLGSSYGADLR